MDSYFKIKEPYFKNNDLYFKNKDPYFKIKDSYSKIKLGERELLKVSLGVAIGGFLF